MRRIPYLSLFIGHVGDARDIQAVLAHGLEAIVDLAVNESPLTPPRGLVYCRFPLIDGAGNSSSLLNLAITTVAGLVRADLSTLVCCSAGMSRSICIAAAAIAVIRKRPFREVLTEISATSPADVSPALLAEVQAVLDKHSPDCPTSVPQLD